MIVEVLVIIAGVLFSISAVSAYVYRNSYIGGSTAKEWKYLYTGLAIVGLALILRGVSLILSDSLISTVASMAVFLGAGILAFSCFVFWNRFRL